MKLEEYSSLVQKEPFFETTNLTTHKEFDVFYDKIKTKDLLFRGIHEAKYKIYTSAQREWIINEYSKQGITFIQFIQSILTNIRKNSILSHYYKSLNVNENDLLYISLLQHYGAPSPLLDFTHSLINALYFALDGLKVTSSNIDIDNYFSLYILDRNKCGDQLVDIVTMLSNDLETGKKRLEEFRTMNLNQAVNYSLLKHIDEYTTWIKDDGTNEGLCKINCGFLDNPLNSRTFSMYESYEIFYWSNINLIAQKGCFVFYTNEKEPLEHYFGGINTWLPKLTCVNIHKSLAEYIKNKYLTSVSKTDIYPDLNTMSKGAYDCFKKELL